MSGLRDLVSGPGYEERHVIRALTIWGVSYAIQVRTLKVWSLRNQMLQLYALVLGFT